MRQNLKQFFKFSIIFLALCTGRLNADGLLNAGKNTSWPLIYADNRIDSHACWQFNGAELWKIIEAREQPVYALIKQGHQTGSIRKPGAVATLRSVKVVSFELTADALCLTSTKIPYRDLCLFFGYQDSLHFYYTHFSAKSDAVHNIIAIVNGADRRKINHEAPGASKARLSSDCWHQLKIIRQADTGLIQAFIDDFDTPVMTARDTTFRTGRIGIGSFDDTGLFKNIKLYGELSK